MRALPFPQKKRIISFSSTYTHNLGYSYVEPECYYYILRGKSLEIITLCGENNKQPLIALTYVYKFFNIGIITVFVVLHKLINLKRIIANTY